MKKFFIFVFISFLALPLFAEDTNKGIGLTVGLDYASKSVWRGMYIYEKEGKFSPFVSYDVLDLGLSVTAEATIVDDYIFEGKKHNDRFRDNNFVGLSVDYLNKIGFATLGAGTWYGRYRNHDLSYSETYVSLAFEDIFLSPTITYIHDYYFKAQEQDALGKDLPKGKDFYVQCGISHSFELVQYVSLTLGASAGYYNVASWDELSGISDIDFSAKLAVEAGAATYSAGFHYVIVPSKDFYYHYDLYYLERLREKKDISRFYATFGVAYSF